MYEVPHYKLAISVLVQLFGFVQLYLEAIAILTAVILAPKDVAIAVSKKVIISASVIKVAILS